MKGGLIHVELPKHQVAIAGKVVDAQNSQPIQGARVEIVSGPEAFQRLLSIREKQSGAGWEKLTTRVDRTESAADGCFRFIDLPDGAYTVSVTGPPGLYYGAAQKPYTVQRNAEGEIAAAIVPIALPPTGARGTVQAQETSAPLSLARVRVEGGDEVAYCDKNGLFLLSKVQPGARRLSISASGYQRTVATAQITTGTIIDLGTINLQPAQA